MFEAPAPSAPGRPRPRWRHGATVAAMALGASVTIVGSLLPWVRSGSRYRNSYDTFALVERLGFSPDGVVGTALRWWPLVPLLTLGGFVVAWWGWRRAGGAIGTLAGLYAGGVGWAVTAAPAVVDIRPGAAVTGVGGTLLALASIATFALSGNGRTAPTPPAA